MPPKAGRSAAPISLPKGHVEHAGTPHSLRRAEASLPLFGRQDARHTRTRRFWEIFGQFTSPAVARNELEQVKIEELAQQRRKAGIAAQSASRRGATWHVDADLGVAHPRATRVGVSVTHRLSVRIPG